MSVHVSARVWDECQQSGEALLVMLALADHSNDAGECWPSLERIAAMARVEKRSAIRILARLEAGGELEVEHGRGRGNTNRYTLRRYARIASNGDRESPISAEMVTGSHLLGGIGDRESPITLNGDRESPIGVSKGDRESPITTGHNAEKVTLDAEKVTPGSPEPLKENHQEPTTTTDTTAAAGAAGSDPEQPGNRWAPFYADAGALWGVSGVRRDGAPMAWAGQLAIQFGHFADDDVELARQLLRSWAKSDEFRFAQAPTLAPPKAAHWLNANAPYLLAVQR